MRQGEAVQLLQTGLQSEAYIQELERAFRQLVGSVSLCVKAYAQWSTRWRSKTNSAHPYIVVVKGQGMAFRDGLRWECGRTDKPPALAVGSCHDLLAQNLR